MHGGKIGFNTVKFTTAFLYSDWLYFLWHGINIVSKVVISWVAAEMLGDPKCVNLSSLLTIFFSFQSCKIYLCGTKYDIVHSDKKLRQVDYHVTTDYADGKQF